MSAGYSNAWASPRLSGSREVDDNFNQDFAVVETSTKIPKHRKAKIKRIRHPTESYLLLKFIQFVTVFTLNVLLFSLSVVFFCTIFPIVLLVRKLISACCVRYNSRNGKLRQINSLESLWLLPTSKVNNVSMSSIFFLMEGQISKEEVCEFISEKWLYYCGNRKNFRFPKFREFAVEICSGFAWKQTANFQTDNYVAISTDKYKLFLGNADGSEISHHSGLNDQETGKQQLWKVTVLPKYSNDCEDTGLLFQMHASVADAFPFARLTLESLGYKTVYLKDRCYPMQQSCLYLSTAFAGPLMVLKRIILPRLKCGLDRAPLLSAVCGNDATVLWSDPIDFKFIKKIKDITRTKVNVVLMSCLSGAMRSFLFRCGEDYPTDVRACVPINIRPQHAKLQLDNKLSASFVDLPSGTEGAVPRLWEMRRRMDTFSGIVERYALYGFLQVVNLLFPLSFGRRLVEFIINKSSCTVMYMPGPNTPVYLNGKMAKLMTSWTPRVTNKGISMSLVTHANQIRLGVVIHQQLACDPRVLLVEFQREIEELYRHLSNRTLPSHLRVRARQQMADGMREENNANEEEV